MDMLMGTKTGINVATLAAAANLELIFGLNARAREATDKQWDGRYGMHNLVAYIASQNVSIFPVAGFELGE
eukprot:SAG31_NODE_5328_length_2605_cov_2.959346_1_plen_71_part_00